MSKLQAMQAVLFGLLVGAFCSGCGPKNPGGNTDNEGGEAGSLVQPKTGGSTGNDPGTGGSSSGGRQDLPATGGDCACTGGSISAFGGTPGAAGSSGSLNVGGEAGAPEGTGGSEDGGEAGSDPGTGGSSGSSGSPGVGGDVGTGGVPGIGGTDDGGTSGSSGSLNVGGEAGAPEGTGGSEDGGASGNPATGGEAGSDPGTGGSSGSSGSPGVGGSSGEPATGGEAGEGSGGDSGASAGGTGGVAACVEYNGQCTETADCCDDMVCSVGACIDEGPRCPIIGDECVGNQCCEGVCTNGVCAMEPLNCDAPVSDAEFAAFEYDLVDGLWASAQDDVYVAAGEITGPGILPHFDGASWTEVVLPDPQPVALKSVHGTGTDNVWVGGGIGYTDATTPSTIFYHKDGSGWSSETIPLLNSWLYGAPVSIWTYEGIVYAIVDYSSGSRYWDSEIYVRNAQGVWTNMMTPAHQAPFRLLKIWGRSENELYAVGGKLALDGVNIAGWDGGVLWYYDGSTWSEVMTLPSDFSYFSDVHGNDDGEIYVTGVARYNDNGRGAVLVSTDLVDWARYDVAYLTAADSVATSRLGAAIVGLWMSDSPTHGDARVSVMSEWTLGQPQALGSGVNYVNGIQFVPGTDVAILVGTDGTDSGSLFRMTCQ